MADGDSSGGAGMGIVVGALLVIVVIIALVVFGGGMFRGGGSSPAKVADVSISAGSTGGGK